MDGLVDVAHEIAGHAAENTLCTALVENLGVAFGLYDGHGVLALVLSDFSADAHTLVEEFDDAIVDFIDLSAQIFEAVCAVGNVANHEFVEDEVQHVGGDLLACIAQGAVGRAMAFDDKSVESQVHGLLAEGCYEFARTADMAWVAEDGQFGNAAMEFDGQVPHRRIAIDAFVVRGEAAVDNGQARDACAIEAFEAANPQFEVGIDGVLHQHGHILALERIGQFLHGEGVGHGAGTNPQDVHAGFQRCLNVFRRGHFGGRKHAEFVLDTLEPRQASGTYAFETAGLGARFPNAGAQDAHTFGCQLGSGVHDLFFGFCRTGTGDNQWAFVADAGQIEGSDMESHNRGVVRVS